MKFTNKLFPIILCCSILLSGCGEPDYGIKYADGAVSSAKLLSETEEGKAKSFASDLCVLDKNVDAVGVDMDEVASAASFDINSKKVLYSKNGLNKMYPASLTKVVTALVALKKGSADMMLTASENATKLESGAQKLGLNPGDTMTLEQALYILMLYSANDVATMIAENIGGSVEGFTQMMNEEAWSLGATNTHFANANGLHDEDHYSTAYDMYLIFEEAMQYELFNQIINTASYDTVYYNSKGDSKSCSVENTNGYVSGKYQAPDGVNVIGGKTGTTSAAGHCLILSTRDSSGNPYISVVLKADDTNLVYEQMNRMLLLE